jgi:hypothetical protein
MRNVTPSISTVTTNGTVAAGALKVVFIFSSNFAGTLLGAAFTGAVDDEITLEVEDNLLPAIPYTVSAGSARIVAYRRA